MAHFLSGKGPGFHFRPSPLSDQVFHRQTSPDDPPPAVEPPAPPSWFQPSRITAYFRTFLTTLWTAPAAALSLVQRTYQLYRKSYYCIAPTISLHEEKIQAAFKRIQAHREYHLMHPIILAKELLNRVPEDEKAFNYFREYLSKDTTLGETLELIHRVGPQQSYRKLLASVDLEQVFYFQMLHKMEQAFSNHKSRLLIGQRIGRASLTEVTEAHERYKAQLIESRQKTLQQHGVLIEQLEKAQRELKTELYPRLSEIYKISEPAAFAALEKIFSDDTKIFSGRILILGTDESIMGKNKLIAVRSIFIQQQTGQYRFYNSINPAEGFHVYSNKKKFLTALQQQLLALGSEVQIQFSI
jgi:hypothetical protein